MISMDFARLVSDRRLKVYNVPEKSLQRYIATQNQQQSITKRKLDCAPDEVFRVRDKEIATETEFEEESKLGKSDMFDFYDPNGISDDQIVDNLTGHLKDVFNVQQDKPGKGKVSKNELAEWSESILVKQRGQKQQLTMDDFKLLMVIGRGTFGKVFLAQLHGKDKLYAIKSIRKDIMIEKDQVDGVALEKDIMLNCDHVFVCGMDYLFQNKLRVYFVMPFIKGAELFKVFSKQRTFTEETVKFYAVQLILGVGYLHDQGIAHRDLKLENILIDEDGYIKLIDFGLAKMMTDDKLANTIAGTPMYLAPEVLRGTGHGLSVDWWAIGILMFELLFSVTPFWSRNKFEMQKKIIQGKFVFPDRKKYQFVYSQEIVHVINDLLNGDKNKRLGAQGGAKEVLAHPYFSDVDTNAYLQKKIKPPFKPNFQSKRGLEDFFNVKKDKQSMMDTVVPLNAQKKVEK